MIDISSFEILVSFSLYLKHLMLLPFQTSVSLYLVIHNILVGGFGYVAYAYHVLYLIIR